MPGPRYGKGPPASVPRLQRPHSRMAAVGMAVSQAKRPQTWCHAGWASFPYATRGSTETLGMDTSPEVRLCEAHQISQHGFRKGRGTDLALVVHLNCWEHARLTNSPLYLSS